MTNPPTSDVIVVGAGPAGLTAALALAAVGLEVIIAAPAYDEAMAAADARTTALLLDSIALFENLGAWELCAGQSEPLLAIRIIDDRGELLRAPEVLFRACELGLPSFGANIANPALIRALAAAVRRHPRLRWQATAAVGAVTSSADAVRVVLAEGDTLLARLVVGADGANSLVRKSAGIAADRWSYPQAAIAGTVRHSSGQDGVTSELHTRAGPLTLVPLSADVASFVWVAQPDRAERLGHRDAQGFLAELALCLRGLLGSLLSVGPRASFALTGLSARRMGKRRMALVGEAAHVVPPIGAQGLNLSLRDAAALADCLADARARGEDIGGAATLHAYDRARWGDVLTRSACIDFFNRSLLTDFLPLAAARGIGLHMLANIPAVRRLVMRAGMRPLGPPPRLMQRSN
jgi:2-octaprenyl-6-methoxyphenol hydroxylase